MRLSLKQHITTAPITNSLNMSYYLQKTHRFSRIALDALDFSVKGLCFMAEKKNPQKTNQISSHLLQSFTPILDKCKRAATVCANSNPPTAQDALTDQTPGPVFI